MALKLSVIFTENSTVFGESWPEEKNRHHLCEWEEWETLMSSSSTVYLITWHYHAAAEFYLSPEQQYLAL